MARVKVEGVRELRATVGNLLNALEGQERSRYGQMTYQTMADASKYLTDTIRSRATAAGWPRASVASIFWYGESKREYDGGRETGYSRRIRANLIGVRKGAPPREDAAIYKEWRASGKNQSPRKKRGGGELIGMSLAAMYEHGTTKMLARPAFREGYNIAKSGVRRILIEGYRAIIADANRTV